MKYLFSLLAFLSISIAISAQPEIVKWNVDIQKPNEDTYILGAVASIEDGWSLYSQHTSDDGPVPTTFTYTGIVPKGETREKGVLLEEFDDLFETTVKKYKKGVSFTQVFKAEEGKKKMSVIINYMVCDDLKCLPPKDVEFEFDL